MIANLADLDAFVERTVIEPFGYKCLNEEVEEFRERVPTAENICIEIFNRVRKFPHASLERVLLEGKLEHNGNKCLTWQMGHVNIYTDPRTKSKMPVKPAGEDHKKIDGVIGILLAFAQARLTTAEENWFKSGQASSASDHLPGNHPPSS